MDSNSLLAIAIYATPLALACGAWFWMRSRGDKRTLAGIERLGNDAIIMCIGGELPFGFLHEVGVQTEMKHGEP
jgi:hypothetical protein